MAQLPRRAEFIIRDAYVMTMDASRGDLARGSVHVRDGAIVAVGADVDAPGVEVIDGAGKIVMPGLVDTHWHCWNTLFRSFSGDTPEHGYFVTVARFGMNMTPDDMYRGVRLAMAEAINSGTTFVHDWCHNVRSKEHSDADLRAVADSGIRVRFSCGWRQGLPDDEPVDQAPLEAYAAAWDCHSNEGLIDLGAAWRGPFRAQPIPEPLYRAEFENARRLGLPVTVHAGSARKAVGQIAKLARENMLGPDVQIIHGLAASADEIAAMREAGASISFSPGSELRIGFGLSVLSECLDAGLRVGASMDTSALTGASSLFGVLKLMRDVENGKWESEFKLTARRALEIGTIEGARSMALDHKIGSLTPGKRADLIMIDPDTLNMGVVADVAHAVLECTLPENIDTVVVDGRILKRAGRLTAIDPQAVIADARASLAAVRERTTWR
ncbi:MAG: amidohydrolase family protein [Pseudolabrys sp.]